MELDINRFIRMGYSQEAAQFQYEQQKQRMQDEFREKNTLLRSKYADREFTAYSFIEYLFGNEDSIMVVTSGDFYDNKGSLHHGTYKMMDVDDAVKYQSSRADVFVPPAAFFHGHNALDSCKFIYSLVVDLDDVSPESLADIMKKNFYGSSAIVNSGSGFHLYFCLKEPVPFYKRNRAQLQNLYKQISSIVGHDIRGNVDYHSLIQAFRLPGSRTKVDMSTTGFECGEKWDIYDLAKEFQVEDFEVYLETIDEMSQAEYNELKKAKMTGRRCPKCGKGDLMRRQSEKGILLGCSEYPKCDYMESEEGKEIKRRSYKMKTNLYEYCLDRVYTDTQEGNRYLSMVGLTIIAYKGNIPKEKVREDLEKLVDEWNNGEGATVKDREIEKALRTYNGKALKTPRKRIEEMFGWEFSQEKRKERVARKKKYDELQEEINRDSVLRENLLKAKVFKTDANGDPIKDKQGNYILDRRKYALRDARYERDKKQRDRGKVWNENGGRKNKKLQVYSWRQEHEEGRKYECVKDLGIDKKTVYRWWDVRYEDLSEKEKASYEEQKRMKYYSDRMGEIEKK